MDILTYILDDIDKNNRTFIKRNNIQNEYQFTKKEIDEIKKQYKIQKNYYLKKCINPKYYEKNNNIIHERCKCNINKCIWKQEKNVYDLSICMSVGQYLDDKTFNIFIKYLCSKSKYVYFDTPTRLEYQIMRKNNKKTKLDDNYCIKRNQKWYINTISKYFRRVSHQILQSKRHFRSKLSSNIPGLIYIQD